MALELTPIQRDVIRCVLHRASLSVEEISVLIPYKPHSIRRCLEQLRESKLIRKSILCNFYKLGYLSYNLHFSVRGNKTHLVPKLIQELVAHPKVSWCAQCSGAFDYEISVLSRDRRGVTDLIDLISDTFGDIIEKKQFVTELAHNYFGYKYISSLPIPVPVVSFGECEDHHQIDQLDATLMRILSSHGDVPLTEVARKLQMPANKLAYRKQKLIERGLLLREAYFLDRTLMVPVTLSAFITVSNHDAEFRESFMSFCAEHPNVWCCHKCLGAWDYRVGIYANDLPTARATLEKIKILFGSKMLSIATSTLLSEFKFSFFPFDASTVAVQASSLDRKVA